VRNFNFIAVFARQIGNRYRKTQQIAVNHNRLYTEKRNWDTFRILTVIQSPLGNLTASCYLFKLAYSFIHTAASRILIFSEVSPISFVESSILGFWKTMKSIQYKKKQLQNYGNLYKKIQLDRLNTCFEFKWTSQLSISHVCGVL
jgi:hypothetical protein